MRVKRVAIFGAGTMGSAIAYAVATKDVEVILGDVSEEIARKAKESIELRFLKRDIEKGKLSKDQGENVLERIEVAKDVRDVTDVDLVIEAIFEDLSAKKKLFEHLNEVCSYDTIFASNTSTISITKLAEVSLRPDRFIGLHFFNPAHVMKLVEVIPGLKTREDVIEVSCEFVRSIGKIGIRVKNCPGFLVNRIFLTYVSEAYLALEEGISPLEIDGSIKRLGFPMGPMELADMVGHDISIHTFPILHSAYGERFPIPSIVEKLVSRGRLGVKSKKGVYTEGKIDDELSSIIEEVQREKPIQKIPFSAERLVIRMINEAVFCLTEGIASAADIDTAMVLGTGFPHGGPLHLADLWGLDQVLNLLESFKNYSPARFWPHYMIRELVEAGNVGQKVKKGFFTYNN